MRLVPFIMYLADFLKGYGVLHTHDLLSVN